MLFLYIIDFGFEEIERTPKASSVIPLYLKIVYFLNECFGLDPSDNTTGSVQYFLSMMLTRKACYN